jgi:hypothetical protein
VVNKLVWTDHASTSDYGAGALLEELTLAD